MDFSPAVIEHYLSKELDSAVTVTDVEKFGHSSSRETYFVATIDAAGQDLQLVFRRDPAALDPDGDRHRGQGRPVELHPGPPRAVRLRVIRQETLPTNNIRKEAS